MSRTSRHLFAAAAWLLVSRAAPAFAEGADAKIAVPILLKLVTYDRNFASRGGGEFTVLVASDASHGTAREALLAAVRALPVSTIQSRPLSWVGIEVKDADTLSTQVSDAKASAVLAVPGLSSASLDAIAKVAKDKKLYTLALDPAMVEKSLALGVGTSSGRPQIVINLPAATAAGTVFESSVLQHAKLRSEPRRIR